jgi:hypothetical protein
MTPPKHKMLIHGAIVIENALLPIGQLSEEAAEARNKYFRLNLQNRFVAQHVPNRFNNADNFGRSDRPNTPLCDGSLNLNQQISCSDFIYEF